MKAEAFHQSEALHVYSHHIYCVNLTSLVFARNLLSVSGQADKLYYNNINGNTDVAIVTRASMECDMSFTGLCMLWEVGYVLTFICGMCD